MEKQKDTSIVGWGKNRHNVDHYITPESTTKALMEREKFEGTIWECASGDGSMSKILESFNKTLSSDIRDDNEVYGRKGVDFLNDFQPFKFENIITNPPYRYAQQFVEKALSFDEVKKVAMLLKLSFLEGIGRYNFFKSTPLKKVYVFCKRQGVYHADKEPNGSGLIAYAWFVWDKQYSGEPTIDWIYENRKPSDSKGSPSENSFNKDYQETSSEVSQIPNGTSDNPDIMFNLRGRLQSCEKQ
jgi:hypothetical protein